MTTTHPASTPAHDDAAARRPADARAREHASSEYAAYQILRMAAEHPGTCGRTRMARIIGGYSVPFHNEQDAARFAEYAIEIDWPLSELVRLVDSLIHGGLLSLSVGPRPVVCANRAGCRALEALATDQRAP